MNPTSTNDTSIRVKLLVSVTLLAMLGAAIAGAYGYWVARSELEKRLLDDSVTNLASIVKNLRLPPDSERLAQNLKQITDCDIVITRDGSIISQTLSQLNNATFIQDSLSLVSIEGKDYRIASKNIDTDTRLWLLCPQDILSQKLRQSSGIIIVIMGGAGLLAILVAIVIANAYSNLMKKNRDADRRLAKAETVAMAGKLSSSVVHELRNPLSGIKMNAQILAEEYREKSDESDNECLQMIIREIDRIDVFLRSLTDIGEAELSSKNTSQPLAVILRQIVQLMEGKCRQANLTLKLTIDDNLPEFTLSPCPEVHLRQILVNLLTNALEASPDGGTIILAASRRDNSIVLSVSDEGPGVHPRDGEDIFAPFVSHKPKGCGIGLHISRQIAEKYHGTLDWHNLPTHGAEFTLILPA